MQVNTEDNGNVEGETDNKKVMVFDVETQKGFDEVSSIKEMRVAVAVSWDSESHDYKYLY